MSLTSLNFLVGTATLGLQICLLALVILYFFRQEKVERIIVKFALVSSFIFALIGMVMTLVYSEYFGIVPCGLCWLGRVFLYPQVVLFGMAAYRKDFTIAIYSIVLSGIGLVIALYTHYLQMGGNSVLPCPASGVSDCARRYVFEYGYITLPLIGATLFVFLIVLMLFLLRARREESKLKV